MALSQLSPDIRRRVAPIIEFVLKEFDLTALGMSSAKAATHLAQTSGWGTDKPVLLDFHLLGNEIATEVIPLLSRNAKNHGVNASLVTGLSHPAAFYAAISSAARATGFDVTLRVHPYELRQAGSSSLVIEKLAEIGTQPRSVHLVLDFQALFDTRPNIASALETLRRIGSWKSITVLLGAFPKDLADVEKNSQQVLSRLDWLAWRDFVSENPYSAPGFGDYTIQHGVYEEHEGQHLNFSASIRYTADEGWVVMRGEGVLNEDGPGYAQWPANAQLLCGREEFSGSAYCTGDRYIETMSEQTSQTGTAKDWLAAGINHHVTFVVRQIMREFPTAVEARGVVGVGTAQ
jgi:Beta protein